MYFQKYQQAGQWRWRLKAANHEIIASGESYVYEADCDKAINLVKSTTSATPVYKV
ncbi:YegP family protein [Sphingomonas sp. 1P08PE]|uniref:YegP family protein n=1 Tax=Sphingomonas sp. 1P08PE TaxID=554122 RepID=UPI0039A179C4